jgi:tripartite-type tricarboxylate transporter receptor subunit TctC
MSINPRRKIRAGVDMLHVPFKGTGEAMAALLSGDVDLTLYGLAGPKNLPKPIVDRLVAEVQVVLKLPDVVKRFDELDAVVQAGGPKEFGDFWRAEVARYQKLIVDAKVQS